MDSKQLIHSIKEGLKIDFKPVTSGRGSVFLENTNNAGDKETMVFSYLKYPGEFILAEYVYGWKRINAVESILEKYYKKHSLGYNLVTIHTTSRWKKELFEIRIHESEDVEKAIPYLKEMITEDILPFFERYQILEEIYAYMESLQLMKMSEFIFNPMPIRRMILKALMHEVNWEDYALGLLEYTRNEAIKSPRSDYSNEMKYLPELIEELRQMNI